MKNKETARIREPDSIIEGLNRSCSSHIIEEKVLLQTVKDDLKSLIKDTVKIEKLYGIAEEKAMAVQSHVQKELKRVEKQLGEFDIRFDKLLNLHIEGGMTTEMFKHHNERNAHQQQELMNKKANLILAIEEGKNLAERKEAFRKEVERFTDLDISDEQVLKQFLQRLIQTIEVFEDGKIKINYNLSNPLPSN